MKEYGYIGYCGYTDTDENLNLERYQAATKNRLRLSSMENPFFAGWAYSCSRIEHQEKIGKAVEGVRGISAIDFAKKYMNEGDRLYIANLFHLNAGFYDLEKMMEVAALQKVEFCFFAGKITGLDESSIRFVFEMIKSQCAFLPREALEDERPVKMETTSTPKAGRPRKRTTGLEARVVEAVKSGMKYAQIAEQEGVSTATISLIMKDFKNSK